MCLIIHILCDVYIMRRLILCMFLLSEIIRFTHTNTHACVYTHIYISWETITYKLIMLNSSI